MPTPPEMLKGPPSPLLSQILNRKAVEAVLAGGYTTYARETPAPVLRAALPPAPPPRIAHPAILWLCAFGLAGIIGIASSRLPGHAVHARQARHPETLVKVAQAPAAEIKIIAASTAAPAKPAQAAQAAQAARPAASQSRVDATAAAVTREVQKETVTPAAPAPVLALTAPPIFPLSRVTLTPIAKPSPRLQIADAIPVQAASRLQLADSIPVQAAPRPQPQAAPTGSVVNGIALEEVLYEGDPVAPASKVPEARRPAGNDPDEETAAAPARKTSEVTQAAHGALPADTPRVEGIFWDKQRPMALVGGNIVEMGSPVGRYKVATIQPGLVILADGEKRLELRP